MAGTPRKQIRKLRFELTYSAVAGIGVVCFCIFLWMFLLGVWTGESMLRTSVSGTTDPHTTALHKETWNKPK